MNMIEPFTLNTNPAFAELMPKSLAERRAAYADPAWRRRVQEGWAAGQGIQPNWPGSVITEAPHTPSAVGKRLNALAETRNRHPFDVLLDLALAEPDLKLRFESMIANDDADGVAMLLNSEGCTLGLSDAGAHVGQICDAVMPSDLLGNWVRGKSVLTLEQAVNKLTKVQADLFRFTDRGVLRKGAFADVVIFDANTIAPGPTRRVRDFPANGERLTADQPTGIHRVIVNGRTIVDGGKLDEAAVAARPGAWVTPAAYR